MTLSTKQKQPHRHRDQTCGCLGGQGGGRLGGWGWWMQTIIFRMDKQQGPTVLHRELYSIYVINHNGKEYEKECIYMYS